MKNKLFILITFGAVILLVLASGASAQSFAREEDATQADNKQTVAVLTTHVSEAFSYQGVLEENGIPVTGVRDMTFSLYADDICSVFVSGVVDISDVPIDNGLFSVELDFFHSDFTGQLL